MLKIKLKIINYISKLKSKIIAERTNKMPGKTSLLGGIFSLFFKIIILGFFGMLILFPFFYMISGALMTPIEIDDKVNINLLPQEAQWSNFTKAFGQGYWNALFLTSIITFLSIVLKIIITMLMGYAFSLPRWKGKKIIWIFLLSLLMLPEVALMSGQFKVVTQLGWRQGWMLYASLSIPFVASVFSTIMFKNAFEAIPNRTKEASMIDGVSGLKFFIKIAIPMVTPTTWTVGILTAFAAWNSYIWPSILLSGLSGTNVISTWLFTTGHSPNPEQPRLFLEVRLAAALIAILPMFIAYFVMRTRIMRAISKQGSAIKG